MDYLNLNINNAKMAYLQAGSGHPIVMGHSYLWDAHMWKPQIQHFQHRYRCIVPDLWSHGQSDPLPNTPYSVEQLANDYWQFTQSLALKKFALVGLSVGGMWAAHLALAHPEAISALVLMDTYVGAEPEVTKQTYFAILDELEGAHQLTLSFAEKVAPYFFAANTAKEQPALINHFIQRSLATPVQHVSGKVALGRAIFNRTCLLEKLAQIKVPTLVMVGEEDLPRPPKEAQDMAARIPNAQIAIVPKAGHISNLEQAEFVNNTIATFLKQVGVDKDLEIK